MKRIVLMLLVGLCAQHIHAQDWAKARLEKSPRHRERVDIKQGSRAIATMVVYPDAKAKKPVVVLIPDRAGLTDWFQSFADEVAGMGYLVLAPDLSSGGGLPAGQQLTTDLNAVADYGLKLPASSGTLFVAGIGWGGAQSFRFAADRPDVAAPWSSAATRLIRIPSLASKGVSLVFMPAMMHPWMLPFPPRRLPPKPRAWFSKR